MKYLLVLKLEVISSRKSVSQTAETTIDCEPWELEDEIDKEKDKWQTCWDVGVREGKWDDDSFTVSVAQILPLE